MMTLIVSMLNKDRAIQLLGSAPHRQRWNGNGRVRQGSPCDHSRRAPPDGPLRLSHYGKIDEVQPYGEAFDLRRTIATTLLDVAGPEYVWEPTARRLAEGLTDVFTQPAISRLPRPVRRCVIHFVGFDGKTNPPTPISTFVSNFHDIHAKEIASDVVWDEFRTTTGRFTGDGLVAQAIGAYSHIEHEDMDPLLQLMRDGKPPEAVIGKGVELFREWAARLGDDGVIGKQIATTILPSDMYQPATTDYHSDITQGEIFGLGEIRIDGPHSYATEGIQLKRVDGPAIGPKLGRNEPCWCESGRKYKQCHGSPSGSGQTMTIELQRLSDENNTN